MQIRPILEKDASEDLRKSYAVLKKAFNTQSLPLFFTYLGVFPDYFVYISDQLVKNLKDPQFQILVDQLQQTTVAQIHTFIPRSQDLQLWIERYKNNPDFYHFQKDLVHICQTNMKLACIFIAIREAVKGWAIAARKLTDQTYEKKMEQKTAIPEEKFVFEPEELGVTFEKYSGSHNNKNALATKAHGLEKRGSQGLSVNLLSDYLRLSQTDFQLRMKEERFWTTRVQIEKNILNTLTVFPSLIYSPFNVIARFIGDDERFYEFLYLLSENFPTLSMHRLLFSGFMLV
jgi:hypothetical protein